MTKMPLRILTIIQGLNMLQMTYHSLLGDMNPTTDHVHVPEGPITRSKVKKIQEAYTLHLQKLASVPVETKTLRPKIFIALAYQIKKIMEWLILESN